MAQASIHANLNVGRKGNNTLKKAQEYLELGYKIIAIVGDSGSGKSTLGNLYCGRTENLPFFVEDRQIEGTLETTGYADDTNRIYWLDTRGLGQIFGFTPWMEMLETLVVHGLILVSYPLPRSGSQLQTFSTYVNTQGFNCLKVFRSDLLPMVKCLAKPHMYEDFLPFNKDTRDPHIFDFIAHTLALPQSTTFQVYDVPNLITRVNVLRNALDTAERNNEILQQNNAVLQENNDQLQQENELLRVQLQEKQRELEEQTTSFNRLSRCFNDLQAACWTFTENILRPRSRDSNDRHPPNDEHRFQRRGFNHLFSLLCLVSGQIGAAVLHEQLLSYSREVRRRATALRAALFEASPSLSPPTSSSSRGRLTDVSNGDTTTIESRSAAVSVSVAQSELSTSFREYYNENIVTAAAVAAIAAAATAAATAAAAGNPSTPPLSLYSSAQTSPNTSTSQLNAIIDHDPPSEVSHSSEDTSEPLRTSDATDDVLSELPNMPTPRHSMVVHGPAPTADHDVSLLVSVTPMSSSMSMSMSASTLSLDSLVLGPTASPSSR